MNATALPASSIGWYQVHTQRVGALAASPLTKAVSRHRSHDVCFLAWQGMRVVNKKRTKIVEEKASLTFTKRLSFGIEGRLRFLYNSE